MKVIFHGDDFGLTSGVNKGIIRSFSEGLLTSASLIAGGKAAQEAISLAKDNPGLDMGIHLVLCDEPPVLRPGDLSSIISSGTCFPSRKQVLRAILARRIDYKEVEAEWNAQVETLLNAGVRVSHLDSHQYIHLFPGLMAVFLKIVKKYDIPFVRGSINDPASLETGFKRLIQWTGLSLWTRSFVSRSLPSHVRVLPSVGFLAAGGRLNSDMLLKTLESLRSKKSAHAVEVILHPGIGDAYTFNKYSHWGYDWKKDLDLLTDRTLKKSLVLRGIKTTSFRKEL